MVGADETTELLFLMFSSESMKFFFVRPKRDLMLSRWGRNHPEQIFG